MPGPGNYDPNTVLTKSHAPNFHMGMKTKPIVDQADPKNPGPGTYQPMESLVKESQSVGGKFGHDKRKGMGASEAPGPGAYDMMYEPGSERPKFAFVQLYAWRMTCTSSTLSFLKQSSTSCNSFLMAVSSI